MNNIAAVVVTYNRRELLLENIEHLLAQSRPADILIIDNNSTDDTCARLQPYILSGKINYINTGENLGGAGGFSFGINEAVRRGYEYVWVMDDDCMPTEDALKELMAADEALGGNYGFLSGKVLWKDGSVCVMNVQRRTLTRPLKKFDEKYIPVVMASFVSLLIKTSVVRELGLPIKEFFIWTDDWEYTRRISRRYPCYVVSDSVVVHKSQSNIGANIASDSLDRLDRYTYLYRNDVYLYSREGFKGFCYECARLTVHFFKILFKARGGRWKRIKTMFGGTKRGFKFKPQIRFPDDSHENT